MRAPIWLIALRNGAILATLSAAPIVVGYLWNALWGEHANVTGGMYVALIFAWLVATGVVAALTWNVMQLRGADAVRWFYPCAHCGRGVAIVSFRCLHCRTNFTPPPEAGAFRNALLMGVGVFYALFGVGILIVGRVVN